MAQSEAQANEIVASRTHVPAHKLTDFEEEEDDWEDFDEEEDLQLPSSKDDEWEDWDDEEEYALSKLSRKEKKILAKEAKKASRKKAKEKEMKKPPQSREETNWLQSRFTHDENYNRAPIGGSKIRTYWWNWCSRRRDYNRSWWRSGRIWRPRNQESETAQQSNGRIGMDYARI